MTAALACILLAQSPEKLTNVQVLAKIRQVPVFLLVGSDNAPIVQGQGEAAKVEIYFGVAEAKAKASKTAKVAPYSLADVLVLASLGKLEFLPSAAERDKALSLAKEARPDTKAFPGVPLFAVIAGQNYVTINQTEKPMIPLFFSWEEAEEFRKRAASAASEAASKLMPTNLDQVMQVLRNAPAAQASGFVLIPHRKALEDVKALQKPGGAPFPRS